MERPKRIVPKIELKDEKISKAWTEREVEIVLKGILKHGHLDYSQILQDLPGKTVKHYQQLLRSISAQAKSKEVTESEFTHNLNEWIEMCESMGGSEEGAAADPMSITMALQLLSRDGVLENHPLPQDAGGVDFGACYRVLSQAICGHPIQPVNKPTLDLLYDIFTDVYHSVESNETAFKEMTNFLQSNKWMKKSYLSQEATVAGIYGENVPKVKKTYERKRPASTAARSDSEKIAHIEPTPSTKQKNNVLKDESPNRIDLPATSATHLLPANLVSSIPDEPIASTKSKEEDKPLELPKTGDCEETCRFELTDREKVVMSSTRYNPMGFPITWLHDMDADGLPRIFKNVNQIFVPK